MNIHESGENYLESICILEERLGNVRSIDVVNHLGFSKPTVSVAVHTLERNGYITISEKGYLKLTETGRKVAVRIYERHKVLTEILTMIGVPEETAMQDACKLEHDLSEESFDKIKEALAKHKALSKKEPAERNGCGGRVSECTDCGSSFLRS